MPRGRGSNMRWDQISAQGVGSPTESMNTALRGISQVGTVFGDLRKSILDQEQRDVDNAYREKAFSENVRQFEVKQELEQDKFGLDINKLNEQIRHAKETETNAANKLAEDVRNNKAIDARGWASINDARAERRRLEKDRNDLNTAMGTVLGMPSKLNERMREIQSLENEADLPMDAYISLKNEYSQLGDANKKLTSESGRQYALMNALTEMGRGDLAYPIAQQRATSEQERGKEAEKSLYRFKEKEFIERQDRYKKNLENEQKATKEVAKILATIPEGLIFGKYQTEAKLAVETARSLGLSDQQINNALLQFSTSDKNWFFDTPMQNAVQQWNEDRTGPLAVAFGKVGKEEKETTPSPPPKKEGTTTKPKEPTTKPSPLVGKKLTEEEQLEAARTSQTDISRQREERNTEINKRIKTLEEEHKKVTDSDKKRLIMNEIIQLRAKLR